MADCRLANHRLYDYIYIHFAHLMHCLCHLGSLCEAFLMVTTLQRVFAAPAERNLILSRRNKAFSIYAIFTLGNS